MMLMSNYQCYDVGFRPFVLTEVTDPAFLEIILWIRTKPGMCMPIIATPINNHMPCEVLDNLSFPKLQRLHP